MNGFRYSAVVLDLDGVITATRQLHVQAWKKAFDEFLAQRRAQSPRQTQDPRLCPFDPIADYANFVDGKPRSDGIRSFLASRAIAADAKCVEELGARKNFYYLALLEKEGPQVFADSVEALQLWRKRGIPVAVVSSSRNCAQVLKKADLDRFFQARVDGVVGQELGLRGKPEADYFLEAAKRLKVPPSRVVLVEDALAGVEAGRRGGFGAVIGMDREGRNAKALLEHGAHQAISSLKELFGMPKTVDEAHALD